MAKLAVAYTSIKQLNNILILTENNFTVENLKETTADKFNC